MDPVSTAVISWTTAQLGAAGQHLIRRVFIGDKQQNALVRVVHEAIDSAVTQVLPSDDQEIVREALKRESPGSSEVRRAELTDLKGAVREYVLPTLSILSEQGYRVDVNRFTETLASLISRGIQADAAQGGPLQPAAELLRFQLLMGLGEESVSRLTELNRRPTAFGDLRDSVIDITALFDELELIEPAMSRETYDTYRTSFVGREWLFGQVDNFIASHDRGYVLIEGEAGVGKSAFALWLAATRGYPAHFTRLPGGRETAVAVKNLAAQLIIQMGLDELAPGGALPAASSQPSWLQQIIQIAATHRREARNNAPLVLIVDGLDEAEPASGPPLGLPASLPEGVFIIATTRVGTPLRWIRAIKTTLKILADDDANIEDMRRYLYQAASEPRIAALLSSGDFGIDRFVDTLIERSAGIWIYLRYVLEEMRTGTRLPASLDDLPNGLWDYYTENLNLLRSDISQWDSFFLPILAALAAAQEPVTSSILAIFANLSVAPGEIVRFLANKWRPFCIKFSGDSYSLFHQSLRDFLSGAASLGSEELPEFAATDRSELEAATKQAHRMIATRYLTAWGGLDGGLPTLVTHPQTADMDNGYGLRHLPTHLEAAAAREKIDRLLACEQRSGSGSDMSNVWYSSHDRAGSPDAYLAHLARASALARHATAEACAARQYAPSIAREIRYTLIAARISGVSANLSPEMAAALLKNEVWQPAQTLTHIRNNPRPDVRARAYALALPYLPETDRTEFLTAALESCEVIRSARAKSNALTAVVDLLPEYSRPLFSSVALPAAINLHSRQARAKVLTALVPYLNEPDRATALAEALSAAQTINDVPAQVGALTALVPYLNEPDRATALAEALSAAQTIGDEQVKVDAVVVIAPCLAGQLLLDALKAAYSFESEWARAQAVAALGLQASGDARAAAIASSLAAVRDIKIASAQANVLAMLAPYLNPEQLDESLRIAGSIQDRPARVRLQTELAPHMPVGLRTALLTEALGTIRTIAGEPAKAEALRDISPHLDITQLADALKIAQAISYHPSRQRALAALAPSLTPPLLTEALRSAQAIGGRNLEIEVLASFVPEMPDVHRHEVIAVSLEALRSIEGKPSYSEALASLAPYLPEIDRTTILATALTSARLIRAERFRIDAFKTLARVVPSTLSRVALEAVKTIDNATGRAEVLAALSPNLDWSVLGEAFEIAKDIRLQAARALAVATLAPRLNPSQLEEAIQIARMTRDRIAQAQILTAVAPSLPPELVDDALAVARAIPYAPAKVRALTALSSHLPESDRASVRSVAVDAALSVVRPHPRAQTLALLAAFLDEPSRSTLLESALKASYAIEEVAPRVGALAALVPQLAISNQQAVLAEAVKETVADRSGRTLIRSLSAIGPFLTPVMLTDIIEGAKAIRSEWYRTQAFVALAPYLHILDRYTYADLAQEIHVIGLMRGLTHSNAMLVLKAAVAQVALLGGEEAATECSSAIIDISRWWP